MFSLAALAAVLVLAAFAWASPATCPMCGREVGADYRFCPYDGAAIPEPHCPRCDRTLARDWSFCPWDGTPLGPGAAAPPAPPAAAPGATPPRPAPARPAPLVESVPRSGPAPAERQRAPEGGDRRKNPYDVIEDLFRAIAAGDQATIRSVYDWNRFFPEETDATREERVASYVARLVERVKPTLAGCDRLPVEIKLGRTDAKIKVLLRKSDTHAPVAEYEFALSNDGNGWAVVGIKP
jgi:hypothetical protein